MTAAPDMPKPSAARPLRALTRADLEPLWRRHDIHTARMAAALGVTRQALSLKAKTLGLPSRQNNRVPLTKGDTALFTRMWLAGVTGADMARHFGYRGRSAVSERAKRLGLPRRSTSGRHKISLVTFLERELAAKMIGCRATEKENDE